MFSSHTRPKLFSGRWRLLCVALFSAAMWPLVAWVAAEALVVRADLDHADAVVVLAGSSVYLERTHRAAQLFNEGRARTIILTNDNLPGGWSLAEERNPLFVERAAEQLRRDGVPAANIEVVQRVVAGTYDEISAVREYADAHGLRSILVVTSAYQSRRALWTLRSVFQGSDVTIGLDPVPPGQQSPGTATWWWHALGWKMVPGEYLKIIYYEVRYG